MARHCSMSAGSSVRWPKNDAISGSASKAGTAKVSRNARIPGNPPRRAATLSRGPSSSAQARTGTPTRASVMMPAPRRFRSVRSMAGLLSAFRLHLRTRPRFGFEGLSDDQETGREVRGAVREDRSEVRYVHDQGGGGEAPAPGGILQARQGAQEERLTRWTSS